MKDKKMELVPRELFAAGLISFLLGILFVAGAFPALFSGKVSESQLLIVLFVGIGVMTISLLLCASMVNYLNVGSFRPFIIRSK